MKLQKTGIIPGLTYEEDFITKEEESQLIETIDAQKWDTSISRRTQHYGFIYNYKSKDAVKPAEPIPEWCLFIIDRLIDRGLLKNRPDQMIVNEYKPGQGIAAHVDNVKYFEDGIVSISLNASYGMELSTNRAPIERKELLLARCSALILHGQARYEWRHGIAAKLSDDGIQRGRRISLTFRRMKK